MSITINLTDFEEKELAAVSENTQKGKEQIVKDVLNRYFMIQLMRKSQKEAKPMLDKLGIKNEDDLLNYLA